MIGSLPVERTIREIVIQERCFGDFSCLADRRLMNCYVLAKVVFVNSSFPNTRVFCDVDADLGFQMALLIDLDRGREAHFTLLGAGEYHDIASIRYGHFCTVDLY